MRFVLAPVSVQETRERERERWGLREGGREERGGEYSQSDKMDATIWGKERKREGTFTHTHTHTHSHTHTHTLPSLPPSKTNCGINSNIRAIHDPAL